MFILLVILGFIIIFNLLFLLGCFALSSKESRAEEREIIEKTIQNEEET